MANESARTRAPSVAIPLVAAANEDEKFDFAVQRKGLLWRHGRARASMTDKLIDDLRAGGTRRESAFRRLELKYSEQLASPGDALKIYTLLLSMIEQAHSTEVREAFVNRFYYHIHPDVRADLERQLSGGTSPTEKRLVH